MNVIISIIGILVTLVLVIGIHEFGHFITARLCGVKIHRFSIGFGKRILSWHDKRGTEYVIAAIPLGGYVKMLDENEENVKAHELPFAFNRQPFYKKAAIISAGPIFNILLAIVLYWILFIIGFATIKPIIGEITPHSIAATAGLKPKQEIIMIDNELTPSWEKAMLHIILRAGDHDSMQIESQTLNSHKTTTHSLNLSTWEMDKLKPDPFKSLGIQPYRQAIAPIIETIQPNSPATHSPLKAGDIILSIDKKNIHDWVDMLSIISNSPSNTLSFEVIRNGKKILFPVVIGSKHGWFSKPHGFLGIAPHLTLQKELIKYNQYPPGQAFLYALQETGTYLHLNIITVGKILTGKISFHSLGGPITIFESAGTALNNGVIPFIGFLAFLSISIGFINIIPTPGLDGGHLLFSTIEFIIRRPIPLRAQELFYRLGFVLLLLLIAQALTNDIMRL